MDVTRLETAAALADAVAALPAAGPLPARTVLVRSERHAHALRRALASSGRAAVLAGTRLVSPLAAASEVLAAAGVAFAAGEEALRPGRLLALFRDPRLALEHFDPALLRDTRGWDEAFAGAIATLEGAGLAPEDLPRGDPGARDLALVWARLRAEAETSWSSARICLEAERLLLGDRRAWPFPGPTLAAVTGHESAALARFVRSIPDVALGVRPARPARARHLARVEALFGPAARALAEPRAGAPGPAARGSELALLGGWLLERPERLAAADRPRSAGPDGTVLLEEHAGVDAELEAAAAWVARCVLERGLPLDEIAVLVPAQDPLAGLAAERLERLPFAGGTLPVHVAGGLPATGTAAGARLLAVLRALRAHLSAEALAALLPALRTVEPEGEPRTHLSHGEATELAWALGTAGGNAAHPEGALEWSPRAAGRVGDLERALARARADEDSGAREARRLERTLRNLRAVRPALDALVGVARALVSGAPLAAIQDALGPFLERWLLAPGEGAALPRRLAEALAPACSGPLGTRVAGADALDVVESHLRALRVPRGRYGAPAVYVGTVEDAAGLEFAATRVVGLCEGVLPSLPRESPVLPERLRATLEAAHPGAVLPGADDRVAAQVHALVDAVRSTRAQLALSAPRVDLARTEREPAAHFVEALAALGRPAAGLRRDAFGPAREEAARFRAERPVGEAAWLDRVARVAPELPPAWSGEEALDLARIEALRRPDGRLGAADGVLGAGDPFPRLPGVDPARPISASALRDLLHCPRLFLLVRVLGWEEPAGAASVRELDPLSFGTLLHRTLEALYRAHGEEIVARRGTLARWTRAALALGDRALEELLREHPLVGAGIREKERERLHDALRTFVAHDLGRPGPRRFVGVELPFGEPTPLEVAAGGATLHVHGFIDRVDVEGGATLVRDLKSGRSHPRVGDEAAPDACLDVQLGLYQLAARRLAPTWGTPARVAAAYVYASGRGPVEERAFLGAEAAALADATQGWLATAAHLLHARAFPATPEAGDCRYCPFRPLCGDEAARRAGAGLDEAGDDGPLARFRALKLGEEEEA